jgi:hypothetical protein
MAGITVATLAVAGGLAGALVVAATVVTGCSSDKSNGTTTGTTSNTAASSGGSTGTASSSTSGTSAGDGGTHDTALDGDTTMPPTHCAAAVLNIDASDLLFSFDNGNISIPVGTQSVSWTAGPASNPLDASFDVAGQGNQAVGNACPGSFEMVVPFSTTGQEAIAQFKYPDMGVFYNAKAIHFALKMVFPDNTDASTAFEQELVIFDGAGYSFYQAFAQWTPAGPDGGISDAAAGYSYFSTPHGYNDFPPDGGWLLVTVPILQTDPRDGAVTEVTSDTPLLLTSVGAQFTDPEVLPDSSPAPLPFPLNTQFFIDDVWVE